MLQNPTFLILKQVRPWPGTPLYREFEELGLINRKLGIDDYIHSDYPIVDTLYLTREQLEQWKEKIRRSTILNSHYIWNFLRERRHVSIKQAQQFLKLVIGKSVDWYEK